MVRDGRASVIDHVLEELHDVAASDLRNQLVFPLGDDFAPDRRSDLGADLSFGRPLSFAGTWRLMKSSATASKELAARSAFSASRRH
jgi:hypothetical protein